MVQISWSVNRVVVGGGIDAITVGRRFWESIEDICRVCHKSIVQYSIY